jgi:Uma2 family endonuclease
MTAVLPPQTNGIVLKGVQWETYQALVQDLEAQPGKRLTYDDGTLEIRMPLPPHERNKKLLGRFVEAVTEELDIEIASLGSSTWSRQDLRKGLEADECYYIQNEAVIRGKDVIDLRNDPPPDLAIEVDSTSSSVNRLGIYAALGVPEVWRYDLETLVILELVEGQYQSIERSLALPMLNCTVLMEFLQQSQSVGQTSLIRSLRQWVRNNAMK